MSMPEFSNKPLNKELYIFMKQSGWVLHPHLRSGDYFIHNGAYDRKASSNDGLFEGKNGRFYYCAFQEERDENGKLKWFRGSISSKSKKSNKYRNEIEIKLISDSLDASSSDGWEIITDSEDGEGHNDPLIKESINKIKDFVRKV